MRSITRFLSSVVPVVAISLVSVASAHHSAAASYKADESIDVKGKVVEFAWRNPHCHLYIAVSEGPFEGRTYAVELGSPVALARDGWAKTLLRPGDVVAINVHPSRVGAPLGLCRNCSVEINGKAVKLVWREEEAVQ